MAKVCLWSPAVWVKGAYSKNMLGLGLRLKKAGHEVKNFALTGLAFGKVPYPIVECQDCGHKVFGQFDGSSVCPRCDGMREKHVIEVLPNNSGDHGQDWLPKWNLLEGPFDAVIFHYDAWVLGPGYRPPDNIRLFYYSPVDHSPVPPPLVNTLKGGGTVIAMSHFAQEEFKKAGIPSIYLPHAVDIQIYTPGDRIEARRRLDLPEDCFLICCVARNTGPRKNLGNILRAYRDFLEKVPKAREDSFLFLNTNITAGKDNPRGYNLPEIWNGLGIAERIKYTHPFFYEGIGFTEDELCDIFRASDWTVLASLGEGWGIPLAESLACGTPVIFSNFSACKEVAGPGGLPVEASERIPFELSSSFQWIPRTEQITERICQAYEDWEAGGRLRDELGEKGRQHVLQNYTWDKVMPLWLDLIKGEKEAEAIELPAETPRVDGEVDIIVITHNHLDLFSKCVDSIYRETTLPFHLVVVDDQSIDGTREYVEKLRSEKGNITYIKPREKAKGGAQVMNIGLRYCRNDLIVSMNNDIIVTTGWLEEAVNCINNDEEVGIVGMKFLYPDDKIQHAGGAFIKTGIPLHLGVGEPRDTHNEIKEVSWVSGPCVLIRRRCLEPGWDEVYDNFGGHEDVDLCLRARRQGWKVVYCGKSEVYHLEGATVMSMPDFTKMYLRAREMFLSRWGGTQWVR